MTRQVVVDVRTESGHYVGTFTLSQREFGITPVSVGGGTVNVKDELKIEFDVRLTLSPWHPVPNTPHLTAFKGESWSQKTEKYEGPWQAFTRDIDPSSA